MKFSEFFIGMPVYLYESPDTMGVIIEYDGKEHNEHWVIVSFGSYADEFKLSDLGKFK